MATKPGLRERKKQQTHERIRQCGMRLFLRSGFDQVSVADIAAKADVSKMTVFNYFPAKEDIFLDGAKAIFPDLARVVRDRPRELSVVQAVRGFVLDGLQQRAEWTGLHDGIEHVAAAIWDSPTLLAAATRRWREIREELVLVLDEVAGLPEISGNARWRMPSEHGNVRLPARESLLPDRLRHRMMADHLVGAVQDLATANHLRQAHGVDADAGLADALRAAELAFELVEQGMRDFPGTSGATGEP